jgi:hypothetical protein
MKKLIFKSFIPSIIKETPIRKIKPLEFEWIRKAFEDYKKTKEQNIGGMHTVKCPGIMNVMNTGWVQYAYQDLTIKTFGDYSSYSWASEIDQEKLKYGEVMNQYLNIHTPDQLEKFKPFPIHTLHTIFRIQSPWYVYIPKGYALISMPIPYHDDNRFTPATGILKGENFLNIQLYWHRINSVEIIKKGTPLVQYILLKDEEIELELKEMTDKDVKKAVKILNDIRQR